MRLRLLFAAAVVSAAVASGASAGPPRFDGTVLNPARPAPDFALRDQSGRVVRLSALHGKVVLVTFLYTHCPDVCPLISSHLNDALRRLWEEATDLERRFARVRYTAVRRAHNELADRLVNEALDSQA